MTGINSTERLLAILDLFTEERLEWTPDELMAALGYSRPTLYRYLKALCDAGLLTSFPGTGFTLGPRVVEMDFLMRKSDRLVREGQAQLDALAASWPCTALLVRWYGNKLLCVASECSTPNPLSSYPRGRPMPLARGAISRAILAYLPRRQLQAKIEENFGELTALGLGQTPGDVAESLRKVRRQGCAVAHGEVTRGVVGVAAPVFDAGRSPIAALCVTISVADTDDTRTTAIAAKVWQAAQTLSAALSELRGEGADDSHRETA